MSENLYLQISVLMALAATVSIAMRCLRQPLIIGHIFTGILVGPAVFNLVDDHHSIEILGKFGIALLLFIVGLGLNPRVVKELGKVSIVTGFGQVLFTSLLGFVIVKALGYGNLESVFVAIALSFSSTIVILKLLYDKKEQNKLYGRISIGFLLVQDLLATAALVVASALGNGGFSASDVGSMLLYGCLIVCGVLLAVKLVIRPASSFFEKSSELLFLFAIAWGFGIGALFMKAGFSLEVGALFAGIALSTMNFASDISTRLRPLRDFFIVVFFIALGAGLDLSLVTDVLWQSIGASIFVLIGNPIIVMILMGLLGYTKKTSFKTSLAVAQVSEFSLIFLLLGRDNGQISETAVAMVTIVALITFAVSSYMIIYSENLYIFLEKYLSLFERRRTKREIEHHLHYEVIVFGYRKGGLEFAKAFSKLKKKMIIVDYDPDVLDDINRRGYDCIYGEATDIEMLEEIGITTAKSVISAITDYQTSEFLVKFTRDNNPKAVIICSADSASNASKLYEFGASYVMMPHTIGTEKISSFISKHGLKKREFNNFREKHLKYLNNNLDGI